MGGEVTVNGGKENTVGPLGGAEALSAPVVGLRTAASARRSVVLFLLCAVSVTAAFIEPIWELTRFAAKSSLFSHILLMPFVSAYLIWQTPKEVRWPRVAPSMWAVVPAGLGLALLSLYWFILRPQGPLPASDYLSLMTTAYLSLLLAGVLACFGAGLVRALSFPIGLCVFMIPWPIPFTDAVETLLQLASAEAASALLTLSGTPVLRDGLVFKLPGITLQVAQECSGVHSSLVLFITGLLAGHLLLRSRWRRWVLALAVIPLGILRNGFRILTIAMLCVHVDPGMINSPIHRRGGPLFFVLSLIPFFLLLLWLRRTERTKNCSVASTVKPNP